MGMQYPAAASLVKSNQRGTVSSSAGTGGTATITSVDTTKANVRLLGFLCSAGAAMTGQQMPYLKLTNATTVDFVVQAGLGGTTVTCEFEVMEFI